jgi:penicillin-insensitive murein DD-endopeptidase
LKVKLLIIVFSLLPVWGLAVESVCYGTTSNGRLDNGIALPQSGENYIGYSEFARQAGRTYIHSTVHAIILDAYKKMEKEQPDKVFKYAETGFKNGGEFKPHKTHRNGLSVDFMTPVINKAGQSVHLPTHPENQYGYLIEFDAKGNFGDLSIDYLALAAHLVALHQSALSRGHGIWRVIFDPKLQSGLFETKYGTYIKQHIELSSKPSWVRHDEHCSGQAHPDTFFREFS